MYPLNKHKNIIMSQNKPLESGQTKTKSNISKPREGIGDTILETPKNPPSNQSTSSMLVFHQGNNEETLIDNLPSYEENTQDTNLLRTLGVESTSTERVLKRYWRESLKDVSKQLWLPIETDSHGLDLTYLNGFSKNKIQSSFVTKKVMKNPKMNSQRISFLSSRFLQLDTMEKDNTERSETYTRKIRIYPSQEQKEIFRKWFGCTRFIWNQCLEWIRNNKERGDLKLTNPIFLRENCLLTNKQLDQEDYKELRWMKEIPYDIRDYTLKQLASNFKTNFTHLKKKLIKFFMMKNKRRKNRKQTCFLNKKFFNMKTLRLCPRYLKSPLNLRRKKKIKRYQREIKEVDCEFILTKDGDRYYLCIPLHHEPEKVKEKKRMDSCKRRMNKEKYTSLGLGKEDLAKFKVKERKLLASLKTIPKTIEEEDEMKFPYDTVGLDPGLVTFQTFYSPEGIAGKFGDKTSFDLLSRYGRKEDKLKKILSTTKLKRQTKVNLKKRCSLLRTKIKNIVDDLHWKTISWLTKNFKTILLPSFEVKNMTSKKIPKKIRKLRSKEVRRMLSLSHYKFKERMKYMCSLRGNSLYIVNEAYTSKTCGWCGKEKECKGRMYRCPCGFKLERDLNGSRNIVMKHIADEAFLSVVGLDLAR